MKDELLSLQYPATAYGYANWVLLLVTSFLLVLIFLRQRELIVKPSFWLLLFSHVLFQWPSTLLATFYERFLPNPYVLLLIVHLFVLSGLSLVFLTFRDASRKVWHEIGSPNSPEDLADLTQPLIIIAAILSGLLAIYFAFVPFESTGLYAMLFDPSQSSIAREESLKLLDSRLPKYAYSFALTAAAPLLASIATIKALHSGAHLRSWLICAGFLLYALIASALTGARIGPVVMILVVAFTYLFSRQFRVNPVWVAIAILLALLPAVVLSLLREGLELNTIVERGLTYLVYIGNRTFVVPFEVGAWFIHYAQTVGVESSPFSGAFGKQPNYPNLIGLTYAPQFYGATLETISAPAGFLFSTYLHYGLLSFPLTLLGLLLVDATMFFISRLDRMLFVAAAATLAVGTLSFTQSAYTTVWLTHGFGIKLALLIGLSLVISFSRKAPHH